LAYLSKFGGFGAQVIVLLINTDDLFATAPTFLPVGRDPGYPTHYPPLALVEVVSRLRKPAPIPELVALQQEGGDRVGANLEAIRQIQRLTQQTGSELIVALTPLLREVPPPGGRDYEVNARHRLSQFMVDEHIWFIDFLAAFQDAPTPETLYRDHIHLSVQGYALVSQTLSQAVQKVAVNPTPESLPLPDSLLDDPW
jgi:lysophospholipase L1-like esterase